nr:hypothetical protein Iba_chr15aCG16820 [Ipomoea batatas]
MLEFGDVQSIPSVFSRNCLSLSENFGLGMAAASVLNNGVTCRGELHSSAEYSQAASSLALTLSNKSFLPSVQVALAGVPPENAFIVV